MIQNRNQKDSRIIFAGRILPVANCGESMKNHIFLDRLRDLYSNVIVVETAAPKHHPLRVFNLIWKSIRYYNTPLVLSCSSREAYLFIRLLNLIGRKHIYYWVIGGALHKMIKEGKYKPSVYKNLTGIYAESRQMVSVMNECGLNNVYYCPNFKNINYLPLINKPKDKVKFVFLSRVHPKKGCTLILETVKRLNDVIADNLFDVTFYGPIENGYKEEFKSLMKTVPNAKYEGFLDLTKSQSYDTLASYSVMLFPTWWRGEGFPGIIIDSYVAGLPVIASDWSFNKELVDNTTGWVIPTKDANALFECMKRVIQTNDILDKAKACQAKVLSFDVKNVISIELMNKIQ